jgi:NADH:ubiquinone oxidoreductase subunit E
MEFWCILNYENETIIVIAILLSNLQGMNSYISSHHWHTVSSLLETEVAWRKAVVNVLG